MSFSFLTHVSHNLPDGLALPNNKLKQASPPPSPGTYMFNIASTLLEEGIIKDDPPNKTNTIFLFKDVNLLINEIWLYEIFKLGLSKPSLSFKSVRPPKKIIVS